MKRIFLQTIAVVFVVTAVVSCTRKPTIYANHDITACGVKNPLVNVKWLVDKCEEIKKGKAKEMYSGHGYDCSGKWLYGFRSGMMPFPPEEKEKFFKNKIDLGVIFKFSFK